MVLTWAAAGCAAGLLVALPRAVTLRAHATSVARALVVTAGSLVFALALIGVVRVVEPDATLPFGASLALAFLAAATVAGVRSQR